MPSVYIHYFGDEAAQTILENRGFVTGRGGDQSQHPQVLKSVLSAMNLIVQLLHSALSVECQLLQDILRRGRKRI